VQNLAMWRRKALRTLMNGARAALRDRPSLPSPTGGRQQWSGRPSRESGQRIVVFAPFRFRDGYERFQDPRRKGNMRQQLRMLAVIGGGGTIIWISSQQEIPYTGRKHAILLDVDSEKAMGDQAFQQVAMQAQASGTLLPPHHPASVAVERVGSRIASVAADGFGGGFNKHMKGLRWEFAVIDSPEMNAFVVPGGKVVVYTGLLRLISGEDELAAVLAHEVSHVLARHAAERITQGGVVELLRLLAVSFGNSSPGNVLCLLSFLSHHHGRLRPSNTPSIFPILAWVPH
jgi:hypothetical protein